MDPFIPDTTAHARLDGLERFLEVYLGRRLPEYGESEDRIRSVTMPEPLRRFMRFAGRWPGRSLRSPFVNRFCVQDSLCSITANEWAPVFEVLDNLLVFVVENQGVWVAATEQSGSDPPVWVSEECSHREPLQVWHRLEKPLSHFLVSFVLQEVMFGSEIVAIAPKALEAFGNAGLAIEPIWVDGEYAWDHARPSYFLAGGKILVRHAPDDASGDDWYGCMDGASDTLLKSLGLPTEIP
jgi:hypothetical protein